MMRMQRRMLWAVLAIFGLVVLFFGAKYAKKEYRLRQPDRIWVPITLRQDLSMEDQKKLAEQIEEKLRANEILKAIVMDVGLQAKFKQSSEDAAMEELDRRLFVDVGSADTPNGSVPSINIGVSGTGREKKILEETSMRIIRDVWRMIGIDPETGQPINPGNAPPAGEF